VTASLVAADLALALSLADAADAITTRRFRASDLRVDSKPDLSPVTDADRAVEDMIRSSLAESRPDDAFFGEESGQSGTGTRRWVIDPIDGTANFVRGVPIWASLISLLVNDVPVLGVVSAPALAQRWWAGLGSGAHVRDSGGIRKLRTSAVTALADASLSYASLSGWRDVDRYEPFLGLIDAVWRSRAYGDFYSYMLLADGAVDLVAEPELSLWDMAALAPIVTEAGGRFTGLDGIDGVHRSNALASNGFLHDQALSVIGTSPG
jgi:histidinol-phosphatase